METAISELNELNRQMVQLLADQERQLGEPQTQTAAIKKRADAMEKKADEMVKKADQVVNDLESIRRFDRQTRKLWMMIARKVDWLDEDDIDRWESEDS